jgi:hypothetical protein
MPVKSWMRGVQCRLTQEGTVRSAYEQRYGAIILADECKCRVDWNPFRVTRRIECPIDEHRAVALEEASRLPDVPLDPATCAHPAVVVIPEPPDAA